jgi:TolA-binding protein
MKRAERHHLKQNEFASLAFRTRDAVRERQRQVLAVVVALVVIGGVVLGYYVWRSRVEARASAALAEAIGVSQERVGPPPADTSPQTEPGFRTERERSQASLTKFKSVADEHASTRAGIEARYREAATRVTLGTYKEAAKSYQLVIDAAGDDFLGQMARLGLAEAQARAGEYDQAIGIYTDLAQQKDDRIVETVLMQLGRVYRDAGKRAEAEQTFNRLINEYPASVLAEDARRELDVLKKKPSAN